MNIVVCAKQVPDTAEAELVIDKDEKRIKKEALPLDINEWDNYALEEALLLKEKHTGSVTVITLGDESSEKMLRMCLAKGCDNAVHVLDKDGTAKDSFLTAKILSEAVKKMGFDLILTGVQSSDYGCAQVGQMLAEMLGIPHAAIVSQLEINNKCAKVHCELEGGLEELLEIVLPAVLTIQTGINEPRYASIIGIRKAVGKEIKALTLEELNIKDIKSKTSIERLFIPPKGKKAELIAGTSEEASGKLADILKGKGVFA